MVVCKLKLQEQDRKMNEVAGDGTRTNEAILYSNVECNDFDYFSMFSSVENVLGGVGFREGDGQEERHGKVKLGSNLLLSCLITPHPPPFILPLNTPPHQIQPWSLLNLSNFQSLPQSRILQLPPQLFCDSTDIPHFA